MRKTIYFLLISLCLATTLNGQTFQVADLTDKLIIALEAKDFDAYSRLLVDTTDIKEVLHDFAKNNHIKNEQEKEKEFVDSSNIFFQREFARLISEGEKVGVDWNIIKKTKFDFKKQQLFANETKESLFGYIYFSCQNNIYAIAGIAVYKLSSGYKIWSIVGVVKSDKDKTDNH
jgi:hypothetical protein